MWHTNIVVWSVQIILIYFSKVRTGVDKGSLYSLAINSTASIVLSGSTEKVPNLSINDSIGY